MDNRSPYILAKGLEADIKNLLSKVDVLSLNPKAGVKVISLRRQVVDMRLDVRDYEHSETREEQLKNARNGQERLETLRQDIVAASQYNVFTAVEVAQFVAHAELISERLV